MSILFFWVFVYASTFAEAAHWWSSCIWNDVPDVWMISRSHRVRICTPYPTDETPRALSKWRFRLVPRNVEARNLLRAVSADVQVEQIAPSYESSFCGGSRIVVKLGLNLRINQGASISRDSFGSARFNLQLSRGMGLFYRVFQRLVTFLKPIQLSVPDLAQAKELREKANVEYRKGKELSTQSQDAYRKGDGKQAKVLSEAAKDHREQGDQFNQQAAKIIFSCHNVDRPLHEMDLHDLFVKEARDVVIERLELLKKKKYKGPVTIIVGRGNHSKDNIARIKPEIRSMLEQCSYIVEEDNHNAGRLIVQMRGRSVCSIQ